MYSPVVVVLIWPVISFVAIELNKSAKFSLMMSYVKDNIEEKAFFNETNGLGKCLC